MGIFSFFGKKEKSTERPTLNAESRTISHVSYEPQLVDSLKKDHQELVELFNEISYMGDSGNYEAIPAKLREFKVSLQSHVMVENIKFYVYVEQMYKNDPLHNDFIKDVRREMNGIARAVVNFTKKYDQPFFTQEMRDNFTRELGEIGNVLVRRVELEESKLYSLYTRS